MKKSIVLAMLVIPVLLHANFITREIAITPQTEELFQEWFNDPLEKLIVIMEDGFTLVFVTSTEWFVNLEPREYFLEIKQSGYKISDIKYVVHNHWVLEKFSQGDKNLFNVLIKRGFNGHFLLYVEHSGKTFELVNQN